MQSHHFCSFSSPTRQRNSNHHWQDQSVPSVVGGWPVFLLSFLFWTHTVESVYHTGRTLSTKEMLCSTRVALQKSPSPVIKILPYLVNNGAIIWTSWGPCQFPLAALKRSCRCSGIALQLSVSLPKNARHGVNGFGVRLLYLLIISTNCGPVCKDDWLSHEVHTPSN